MHILQYDGYLSIKNRIPRFIFLLIIFILFSCHTVFPDSEKGWENYLMQWPVADATDWGMNRREFAIISYLKQQGVTRCDSYLPDRDCSLPGSGMLKISIQTAPVKFESGKLKIQKQKVNTRLIKILKISHELIAENEHSNYVFYLNSAGIGSVASFLISFPLIKQYCSGWLSDQNWFFIPDRYLTDFVRKQQKSEVILIKNKDMFRSLISGNCPGIFQKNGPDYLQK